MTLASPPPARRGSRIAAARERAANAKAALLVSAVLAFVGAILVERGSAASSQSSPASAPAPTDSFGGFDSGTIAPSQGPPATSTGTS